MNKDFYNASGCADPMAFSAIRNIQHDDAQHRVNRLITHIKAVAAANDLVLINRIEVKDKKSGLIFK
jgi:hypothetical protein